MDDYALLKKKIRRNRMELQVLIWILGGGFAGTWGLCIFFMNRTDNMITQMRYDMTQMRAEIRSEITEIRAEISELKNCVKDHHARISVIEEK
jgi:hypothetical protein